MANCAGYYIEASERIKRRKFDNQEKERNHLEKAKEKIPELVPLFNALRQTGCKILAAAFISREKMQEAQDENLRIQEEIEKLLLDNGLPKNYLSPIYTCKKCKDTGIVGGKRCDCFMREVKKMQYDELNESANLELSSFKTFNLNLYPQTVINGNGSTYRQNMQKNFDFCKNYAENFTLPDKGIIMTGNPGLGKTHLSLAIAAKVIGKGFYSVYGSAPDLLSRVEREHFGNEEYTKFIIKLKECDLLVIDDLGAEFRTEFAVSVVYDIINTRMNKGLPTIISTNCTMKQLREIYNGRIYSRLAAMELLTFYGNDIRLPNTPK